MRLDELKKSESWHHAYLLAGEVRVLKDKLEKILEEKSGRQLAGNPDYVYFEAKTFGIDDARKMKQLQAQKSLECQFFVVSAEHVTREAQNALLKILEEPTPRTHFFVLVRSADMLLPTLRSRMVTIEEQVQRRRDAARDAMKFLKSSFPERMKAVKRIVDAKDNMRALDLVNNIEAALAEKWKPAMPVAERDDLEETLGSLRYARTRIERNQAQLRILLEHIALAVPSL